MEENALEIEAMRILVESLISYKGSLVGTPAAYTPKKNRKENERTKVSKEMLNYDQVFIRDFIPVALLFLIKGDFEITINGKLELVKGKEIVKNFLEVTLELHQQERSSTFLNTGRVLMPASFKIIKKQGKEKLEPDFGQHAIARVTPVDSSLWWIILLRAYWKATGKTALVHRIDFQEGIRLILELCFSDRFDREPTILVPDGACMIDRRMGIYGYPLEIQVLFYAALRAADELLDRKNHSNKELIPEIKKRLIDLANHMRDEYWMDMEELNKTYQYNVEEYGETAINKYNIYANSIPYANLDDWIPEDGGYLIGNIGPSQMDFRFFSLGNLMAIVSSLATKDMSEKIMKLIKERKKELLGQMPFKICYAAIDGQEWKIVTGCDPKNSPWSYHNGGSWPVLMWMWAAAAQKVGEQEYLNFASSAIELAGKRLQKDEWPEYYDGHTGHLIGREARRNQTWTCAGYLLAKELIGKDGSKHLKLIGFDDYIEPKSKPLSSKL